MIRERVVSSNLCSVGYDADSGVLEIEFHNGRVYRYFDVPEKVYKELMRARSLGSYFSEKIRSGYRYQRVV